MTHPAFSAATARTVIGFFSRNVPMLDQNDDWHHMHITAYQIACEAMATLGHAEETEWGARPVADPRLPADMPRWDDICCAVLKMGGQLRLISCRDPEGPSTPIRAIRDPVRPQAVQPSLNIAAAHGLGPAHAAPELVPILQSLGLVQADKWTSAAELIFWRVQPEEWRLAVASDPRFRAAVDRASMTVPIDIRAEMDKLTTFTEADVARLMARQKSRYERLLAEAGPDTSPPPPLTSDTVQARLGTSRRHYLDWLFFEYWRLPDGWLPPNERTRALDIFHDPLAMQMRSAVMARLYPDQPWCAEGMMGGAP